MKRRSTSLLAALAALLLTALAPAVASAIEPAIGWHSALVVVVEWEAAEDSPAQPADRTTAELLAGIDNELNPYFEQMSKGKFHGIDADDSVNASGPYLIRNPGTCAQRSFDYDVAALAKQAARADGFDVDYYDHFIIYFSEVPSCNWFGEGELGRRIIWLNGTSNGSIILKHELGHNLGLDHSESIRCKDQQGRFVSLSESCVVERALRDPYSRMGRGDHSFAASQQWALGWMGQRMLDLSIGDEPGHDRAHLLLQPLADSAPSIQAFRVVDGGVSLWIEFRASIGIDTPFPGTGLVNGVLFRREASIGPTGSELMDMRVRDGNYANAGLPAGSSWTNPLGKLRFTVNSISPLGADITVENSRTPVPDVLGLRRAAATTTITNAGYTLGSVSTRVDSTCNNVDTVMDQTPGAGNRLAPGTAVSITLGARPAGGCP